MMEFEQTEALRIESREQIILRGHLYWESKCRDMWRYFIHFNSLGPSDAIWRQKTGSTLAQVIACCLTAPNHYLKQCWLIISKVLWHSSEGNFAAGISAITGNYANPVYGVATICHQVRWLRWGHPKLFHTATSLLIWYKMFCVRDISYRLIWMEFINMFSVYAKSGTHSRFNW